MGEYSVNVDLEVDLPLPTRRLPDEWIIRLSDLVLSVLGLILLSPLFGILAILIKLESSGGVFFKQDRVGVNGRLFRMYKFRSMCSDADKMTRKFRSSDDGSIEPVVKLENDVRLTRIGRYIRQFGIDELPQLVNVIKGDMSLVGPRAPVLPEVKLYSDFHKQRLGVKPGITGMAQVNGNSNLPFDRIVEFDIFYIRHKSAKLYYQIVLQTIPFLLLDNGNY